MSREERKKWYEKKGLVIFLIIFFWPLGLVGSIKNKSINRGLKVFFNVLFGFSFVFFSLVVFFGIANTVNGDDAIYEEVTPMKDLSYAGVKRLVVAITIPFGTPEEDAKAALIRAAEEIAAREKPDALAIHGFFEGEYASSDTFTFGEATWAPNGEWGDAGKSAEKEVSVRMGNPIIGKYPTELNSRWKLPIQEIKWFSGGTLHNATIDEWKDATYENQLATCADWLAAIGWTEHLNSNEDYERLKQKANMLVSAVNESLLANDSLDSFNVKEIAAMIITLTNDLSFGS